MVVVSGLALSQVKQKVIDGRQETLHKIVELGVGIIDHQYKLAQAGLVSEDAAKKAALDELASLPYKTNEACVQGIADTEISVLGVRLGPRAILATLRER